jgi:hypothetical protein
MCVLCNYIYIIIYLIDICIHTHASCIKYNAWNIIKPRPFSSGGRNGMNVHPAWSVAVQQNWTKDHQGWKTWIYVVQRYPVEPYPGIFGSWFLQMSLSFILLPLKHPIRFLADWLSPISETAEDSSCDPWKQRWLYGLKIGYQCTQ